MYTKILFIGPMGAGKTTAITAVSDVPPISTETENLDRQQSDKATTTVAMDYGEIHLEQNGMIALYGIPGQERFSFMWPILANNALGAVLLLDHCRTDALDDLTNYLDAFPELVRRIAVVIGVGRTTKPSDLEPYQALLKTRALPLPVFTIDARCRSEVLPLIEVLVASAELDDIWTH